MTEPEAIAVFTSQSARSASWKAFELGVYATIIIMAGMLVCWAPTLATIPSVPVKQGLFNLILQMGIPNLKREMTSPTVPCPTSPVISPQTWSFIHSSVSISGVRQSSC